MLSQQLQQRLTGLSVEFADQVRCRCKTFKMDYDIYSDSDWNINNLLNFDAICYVPTTLFSIIMSISLRVTTQSTNCAASVRPRKISNTLHRKDTVFCRTYIYEISIAIYTLTVACDRTATVLATNHLSQIWQNIDLLCFGFSRQHGIAECNTSHILVRC